MEITMRRAAQTALSFFEQLKSLFSNNPEMRYIEIIGSVDAYLKKRGSYECQLNTI